MGLLCFLEPPSCSCKPWVELLGLSWLSYLYQAALQWVGVGWTRQSKFVSLYLCSVLILSCNEYRPTKMKSFFQSFHNLPSENFTASRLPMHGVDGFLHLQNLLSSNGGLCNAATLCISALFLTLSLLSVCDPQRHLIVVSAPSLPDGAIPLFFTAIESTGAATKAGLSVASISVLSLTPPSHPYCHWYVPHFRGLTAQNSQICLFFEQEILW